MDAVKADEFLPVLLPDNSTVNIEQAGESDMFRLVMFSSGPVDLDSLDQRGMLVQNSCVNDSVTAPKDQRRANPIPLQQKLSRTHLLCTALFGIYEHKNPNLYSLAICRTKPHQPVAPSPPVSILVFGTAAIFANIGNDVGLRCSQPARQGVITRY